MGTHRHHHRRHRRRLALVVVAAMALGACGDDGGDDAGETGDTTAARAPAATTGGASTTASAEEPDDVDRDGTLRIGMSFAGFHPDFTMVPNVATSWIGYVVHGTLLRQNVDGTIEPWLARSARIVDPRTIDVELDPGRTYQDGTPFNAENVKAGVLRNYASPRAAQAFIDGEYRALESIEVTGELTFRIHLNDDVAGSYYYALSQTDWATTSPASPTFAEYPDPNLVGAGPYKLVSFEPDRELVLERWEESPDAERAQIKRIEVVALAPDAFVNALRSGTVDYITGLSPQVAEAVASDSSILLEHVRQGNQAGVVYLNCKRHDGWDDARVRRALSLALDREALSQNLYGGRAVPLDSFLVEEHPHYNPAVKGRNQRDVAEARRLLAEAGYADGIELNAMVQGGDTFGIRTLELVQASVAEAGIDVTITASPNLVQDMFIDRKAQALFVLGGVTRPGVAILTSVYLGSNANSCEVGLPAPDGTLPDAAEQRMIEIVKELRALDQGSDEVEPLWYEAQELALENAWQPAILSPPWTRASSSRVGNPADLPLKANYGPDVLSMYVRAE